MAWENENNYYQMQVWNQDPQSVQIIQQPVPQQPTAIIQQLPSAMYPAVSPVQPGHVKEDLVELMMIQNAQMHQVIMNNMTMSALNAFGYSQSTPQPPPEVPQQPQNYQDASMQHVDPVTSPNKDMRAVPPPPPPSATGTVGADIPPAAEYYDATEDRI
nr:PREDICTED: proline-rich protein 29 isoform X2 [Lepisosteus oculatus]